MTRLIRRILAEIPVPLEQASLFGSRARGDARPDSDVDVLLVFRRLPPDREPYAGDSEWIAADVALRTRVPVTVWSVAISDLEEGQRTPMLVDALADSIPLWCRTAPLPALPFEPADAIRCGQALLMRVDEGSREYAAALAAHDFDSAARRARDDIVRTCTALLLLRGITRPRRGEAVSEACRCTFGPAGAPPWIDDVLGWAATSFGPPGREDGWVDPPPFPPHQVGAVIDALRDRVREGVARLEAGRPAFAASR